MGEWKLMLTLEIKINGSLIDFIHIHNEGKKKDPNYYSYTYGRDEEEWANNNRITHERNLGWEPLVISVLKEIIRVKKGEK